MLWSTVTCHLGVGGGRFCVLFNLSVIFLTSDYSVGGIVRKTDGVKF